MSTTASPATPPASGWGRLSCRACPLASRQDLIESPRGNGDIFDEYAGAEEHMGKPFKKNLTLKRIIELARS